MSEQQEQRSPLMPVDHYYEADALLAEGREVVAKIAILAAQRMHGTDAQYQADTTRMDELGKKAMSIWAQAQVHATLATIRIGGSR